MSSPSIVIYTDGAALGNPGPGGYGAVLLFGPHRRELSEGYRLTTNNRMELLAVIKALQLIQDKSHSINIYTDSKYVCDAIEKGWLENWRKKGYVKIKNPDLWQMFYKMKTEYKLKFHWVKGHAGIPENERCDFLATTAAKANPTNIDTFYEQQSKEDSLL
jgi:ribonuclease HI